MARRTKREKETIELCQQFRCWTCQYGRPRSDLEPMDLESFKQSVVVWDDVDSVIKVHLVSGDALCDRAEMFLHESLVQSATGHGKERPYPDCSMTHDEIVTAYRLDSVLPELVRVHLGLVQSDLITGFLLTPTLNLRLN